MSTLDFVTKLHDAACMIKDACEEYLEKNAPSQQTSTWNPDKIQWTDKTGDKGPYQISEDVNNLEFKSMLKDLAAHEGKLFRDHFFYWTFQNGATVGRKKKSLSTSGNTRARAAAKKLFGTVNAWKCAADAESSRVHS